MSSTAVKRACDACHRRKVKCDGINPCRNCSTAQLTCTYNAIPQKKGPKGSRAKVISELRETQRQTSLSARIHNLIMGGPLEPAPAADSISLKKTPGLLPRETIDAAVKFYFDFLYPLAPILERQRLVQMAALMDHNQSMDSYCVLSSLAAYTMIQPGAPLPAGDNGFNVAAMTGAPIAATQILIDETVRVRKSFDYNCAKPTFNTLVTSYFLFCSYMCLDYQDKAWIYLREASTMAILNNMHMEETYLAYDGVESARRRRLYWLIYVAERIFALKSGRPITLYATINLPTMSDDPSDPLNHQLGSFLQLVNLFRPFDYATASVWTKVRNELDAASLTNLHKQFMQVVSSMANTAQPMEDLIPNQQWLKGVSWKLQSLHGTLNPQDEEANIALQFGRDFAPDIASMQSQFRTPISPMVDPSILGKLMSVTLSLTDCLASKAPSRNVFSKGPREHLNELLNIISVLRNGDHRFLPQLLAKVHDVLQRLPSPLLPEIPEALAHTQDLNSIDLFDGFGNLGMAAINYEEKKYVPEINTSAAMSVGGPPTSVPDLSSPFSPALMSPGMDFPQGLQDFNTPLDMAMSPVGQNLSPGMMNPQPPQQQHQMQQQSMSQAISPQQIQQALSQQLNMNMPGTTISAMGPGITSTMLMGRPMGPPQRSHSFGIANLPRTVGDFQALQRVKTEPQIPQLAPAPPPGGMASMAMNINMTDIDFSGLR